MIVNVFGTLINKERLVYIKPVRRGTLLVAVFDTGQAEETHASEYDNRVVFIDVPDDVLDPATAVATILNGGK